jgi:hypothetical protein
MTECFICSESLDPAPPPTPCAEHADVFDPRPPPLTPDPDVPCDCAKHYPSHPACYDQWFQRHASCPVCRTPSANAELVRVVRIQVAAALAAQEMNTVRNTTRTPRQEEQHQVTFIVIGACGLMMVVLIATILITLPDGLLRSSNYTQVDRPLDDIDSAHGWR